MERVLLIRISQLGDVVLVEPVVRALRVQYPKVKIELLTGARFAPLMARYAGVDVAHAWDYREEAKGLSGLRRTAARLSESYDLVVDLQGKLRTRMLVRMLRARRTLVLQKRTPVSAALSLVGYDPPVADRHTVDMYLGVLAPVGLKAGGSPRFAPGVSQPGLIGLSPGATHATKRWAPKRFAALADVLTEARPELRFLLIGGPKEQALLKAIRGRANRAVFAEVDVASMDVAGLAEQISSLGLLVSVDSGPAHLAAAFSVPVVAIFGPTSPVRWGPRGPAHRVVSLGLDCAPCSNTGGAVCPQPKRDHECMRALSVEAVQLAVEAALDAAG